MGREFNNRGNRGERGELNENRGNRRERGELNERNRAGQGEHGRIGREMNGRRGPGQRNNASRETTGQGVGNRNANVNENTNVNRNANRNVNRNVSLNSQQRSRIHREIFADRSIPRLSRSRVDFDVRVNAVVPRSIRLAAVPEDVVRIYPRFRRDRVVIIEDEVVIIDPVTFRIIAVLPA